MNLNVFYLTAVNKTYKLYKGAKYEKKVNV